MFFHHFVSPATNRRKPFNFTGNMRGINFCQVFCFGSVYGNGMICKKLPSAKFLLQRRTTFVTKFS